MTPWHRRKKSNRKSRQRLDRHGTIAEDALQRIDSLGQNVAIVGGGLVGCELALQLGMTGRTVHLLSRKKEVCRDAAYLYREGLLMELKKVPVKIYNEAECTAITSEGVTVRNADACEYTLLADTVIWAGGYLPMETRRNSSVPLPMISGRSATARRYEKSIMRAGKDTMPAQISK